MTLRGIGHSCPRVGASVERDIALGRIVFTMALFCIPASRHVE